MNYKYILTAILVMSVFSGTASAWLSGYDHRMAITVNNGGTSSLSHYQFNFTNDTNVLVAAGNMQASGADCRITDASDNLLSFWNETPFNAAGTKIWANATTLAVGDNTFYMYYGNPSAVSASNGDNTFEFFDDFNENISLNSVGLNNAPTYQTTPTYDGSGQAIHPDIVYFESGWNGYKYWMAMTPYPNNNDDYENPSILASNDGSSWEVPSGLTNPLIGAPPCDHNNDPDMIYNPVTGELWLYYLKTCRADPCSGHESDPCYDHNCINLFKSSDGVNWTGPTTVMDWDLGTDPIYVSPAIVRIDSTHYYLWAVNASDNGVILYESSDGENWNSPQSANISDLAWHLNVNYIPEKSEYWMILNYPSVDGSLRFATSTDRVNWETFDNEVLSPNGSGWDANLYRTSFLYDATNDVLKVWYCAYTDSHVWHTGYTERNYTDFLGAISSPSKWSLTDSDGSYSIANSIITLNANPATSVCSITSTAGFSPNIALRTKSKLEATAANSQVTQMGWGTSAGLTAVKDGNSLQSYQGTAHYAGCGDGTNYSQTDIGATHFGDWYTYDIIRLGASTQFYKNDALIHTCIYDQNIDRYVSLYVRDSECKVYSDWVLVHKYASPEPAATLGAEETGGGGNNIVLGANKYGMLRKSVTSAQSFSTIAGEFSHDICFTWWDSTNDRWESYYSGDSYNSAKSVPEHDSYFVLMDGTGENVSCSVAAAENVNIPIGWSSTYLRESASKTITAIKSDMGGNCADVYAWDSTASGTGAWTNTGTFSVLPNQGILVDASSGFTWDGSVS